MSNLGPSGYNNGQYNQAGALRFRPKGDARYMPQQVPVHGGYMPQQAPMGHPGQVVRGGQMPVNRGVSRQQQMMQQQMMQQQMMQQQQQQQQQQSSGGMLDMNEFPSLGGSRQATTYSSVATIRNNGGYGEAQRPAEFDLNEASFPALPSSGGPSKNSGHGSSKSNSSAARGGNGHANSNSSNSGGGGRAATQRSASAAGASTSRGDTNSQTRQYGILGLLDVIRMSDPALHMLTLGIDLSSIVPNINSQEYLHTKFASPWSDTPTTGTPAFVLPMCYQMGGQIAARTQHFPKFHEESLLYIFYTMPLDLRQGLAAVQLYKKNWRFHKAWKRWFVPNPKPSSENNHCKYFVFDRESWEKRPYDGPTQGLEEGLLHERDLQYITAKAQALAQAQAQARPANAPAPGAAAGAAGGPAP